MDEGDRKSTQAEIAALRKAASAAPPQFVVLSSSTAYPGEMFSTGIAGSSPGFIGTSPYTSMPMVFGEQPEVVKTCPNGHVFKASGYAITGHQCPMCTARVP